jgi:hypothetical protein
MAKRRRPPSQGWRTFLRNHADGISSMDLFVVPTISFRLLYGLLILQHGRRAVYLLGGHGCCTFCEKSRLGALLCLDLDSSSFLTGHRFPMPRAKEPPGAWPLHCERHFKPIKVSGSVGAARELPSLHPSPEWSTKGGFKSLKKLFCPRPS